MELEARIQIDRSPERVWNYLGNPANVASWDRGVASVEETGSQSSGVGVEFDTVAHDRLKLADQGRMSYLVSEVNPELGRCVVELTSRTGNARFFKMAAWRFEVKPSEQGSLLICTAIFAVRPLYFYLAPLLYLRRSAIMLDLTLLKNAVESHPA